MMKILLISTLIAIFYLTKTYLFNSQDKSSINLNLLEVVDFYTIHYKKYEIPEKINITKKEEQIFDTLTEGINNKYTLRVVGGWLRDKLIGVEANDLDMVIDCNSEEELLEVVKGLFQYLNQTKVENFTDPNYFELVNLIKIKYGKTSFMIFGKVIDLEIMSSNRKVTYPYFFNTTKNYTEDALSRDLKVNSIAYNLRTKQIEDPLNGMEDLRKGILTTASHQKPFGYEFFRIFSIFKTSAKASLKIGDDLHNFIMNNTDILKQFLVYYRTSRTCHKFRKITDDEKNEYSIRAFKLLYDYDFLSVLIPIEHYSPYLYHTNEYKNKIFNLALVSEFIMKYAHHPKFIIYPKQKHYIYNEIFYLAFQDENTTTFFYDTFVDTTNQINKENHKTVLIVAKKYCEINNCFNDILKNINVHQLMEIINTLIL